VLESRPHAEGRKAAPIARLSAVASAYAKRDPGAITNTLGELWSKVASAAPAATTAVISGATGAKPATAEEKAFFARRPELPVRATGTPGRPWRGAQHGDEYCAWRPGGEPR